MDNNDNDNNDNINDDIFNEAISHCRWKNILKNTVLNKINISEYKNKQFDDILIDIYNMCKNINGIGKLTIYDITSCICRYHKININKVYIIGSGPKRAIKLLNLKTKIDKIDNITLDYIEIDDVKNAFEKNNLKLDDHIKNTNDGDIIESYICNWQKMI
jgi:phage regulator Rha-like protein